MKTIQSLAAFGIINNTQLPEILSPAKCLQ